MSKREKISKLFSKIQIATFQWQIDRLEKEIRKLMSE